MLKFSENNNNLSLLNLYFIFFKIGAILLGGGYVILPILTSELTEKRSLISEEDLLDYFTISQSLPGIIAANISIFAGYKLKGKWGAFIAILGIITVPFFTIVLLASLINILATNQYLSGFLRGVGIAVIALIILTVREIWQKSNKDSFFYLIFVLAVLLLLLFNFSPIQTILTILPLGIVFQLLIKKEVE